MHEEQAVSGGMRGAIRELTLDQIRESSGNPRRTFEQAQLREFADFVPGNKSRLGLNRYAVGGTTVV